MSSIVLSRVLTGQHRQLDRLLEDADKLCGTAFEPEALSRFCDAMERHLGVEERVLFPALEQRMGRGGPITVMRQEHDAIRGLMAALRVAEAPGAYGPIVETLTVLVQQHHVKEEHVLYPLSDELLADCAQTLAEALETEEARNLRAVPRCESARATGAFGECNARHTRFAPGRAAASTRAPRALSLIRAYVRARVSL